MGDIFRFSLPWRSRGGCLSARQAERVLLERLERSEKRLNAALWDLAWFYSRTGRQALACSYIERILSRASDSESKASCYLALGQLREQVKDYRSALEYYKQALALGPKDVRVAYFVHNNLGFCLNLFGEHKEAEIHCGTAIEIDPKRHNAYKNLGIALKGEGRFVEAARCFISATRANASDPRALKHLEELVREHPEVSLEMEDIEDRLRECREAVRIATDRQLRNGPRYGG